MKKLHPNNILKLKELADEKAYEQALYLHPELSLKLPEDPTLLVHVKHVTKLLTNFKGTEKQGLGATNIQAFETFSIPSFILRRKMMITEHMLQLNISISDMSKILDHKKDFLLQLLNGTRTFSREDLEVIHRLLGIEMKYLVPGIEHLNKSV